METRTIVAYALILLCVLFLLAMIWRATAARRFVARASRRSRRVKMSAGPRPDEDAAAPGIVGRGGPGRDVAEPPDV